MAPRLETDRVKISAVVPVLLVTSMLLQGCATGRKVKPGSQPAAGQPVKVEEGGDLSDLAKAVKTKDDSLILDLLLGYRMLILRNPDAKSLDKETLKRSRNAYDALENVLRHGGVKAQDAGERVYTINNEDKLSLQEVIHSASVAADKDAREGDWDKAKARWKEIVQSKSAVAWTMEEAQWGLTLSDALASSMPDPLKKKLKDLNESYSADIGHEEIGKQVKALLEEVQDIKLQRELKKVANRAWERDKKAGRITAPQMVATEDTVGKGAQAVAGQNGGQSGATGQNGGGQPASPGPGQPGAGQSSNVDVTVPPAGDGGEIGAQVDTLVGQGKYMAALKTLDKAGSQDWVKQKKSQIGDRFCEDKRKSAANSFKDFKKAATDADKKTLLKKTAADLDSCLFYFPELPVTQKVRHNREMVEGEIKKLKG